MHTHYVCLSYYYSVDCTVYYVHFITCKNRRFTKGWTETNISRSSSVWLSTPQCMNSNCAPCGGDHWSCSSTFPSTHDVCWNSVLKLCLDWNPGVYSLLALRLSALLNLPVHLIFLSCKIEKRVPVISFSVLLWWLTVMYILVECMC